MDARAVKQSQAIDSSLTMTHDQRTVTTSTMYHNPHNLTNHDPNNPCTTPTRSTMITPTPQGHDDMTKMDHARKEPHEGWCNKGSPRCSTTALPLPLRRFAWGSNFFVHSYYFRYPTLTFCEVYSILSLPCHFVFCMGRVMVYFLYFFTLLAPPPCVLGGVGFIFFIALMFLFIILI